MTDAHSKPLYLRTNYYPEGHPYLCEDYTNAEITLMNDKVYPDVRAKFNLVERELVFVDDKNEEMVATVPVKSIRFFSSVVNGVLHEEIKIVSLDKAINTPDVPIYQIMVEGNTKLLKQLIVTYSDQKKYGEATITRTFKRKEVYFAKMQESTELKKVERNKTDLPLLFGKKQAQVSNFITQNELKCKSDEDLIKVFKFYNSL